MEKTKNTISISQKAAQKKYDQKTKMVSIKYTPSDMNEYLRLKNYLDRTGQSTNGFIKNLIKNFFESGEDQKNVVNRVKTPIEKSRERQEGYYPYCWMDDESMQFLYDKFGQKAMDQILNEFAEIVESELDDILEDKGCGFNDWISDIKERMNEDEFFGDSVEEICKNLIEEMCITL